MERGGAAAVLADAELTPPALRAAVDAVLLDPARLRSMAAASRGASRVLARPPTWPGGASCRPAAPPTRRAALTRR